MADRPIGYWLRLVDRLIEERFATIIEEHGVTRTQWQLLSVISQAPADVERLSEAIGPFLATGGAETAAEHLAELIESGWVVIVDGQYTITERGTTAFGKLSEVVEELRGSVAEGLTESEYRTTLTSLERMAQNLGYDG
ncbi:MarR family winged helix-turn-helix transcriptional regulator [Salinibacterium sp. SYSU T00001]|uniref:MarR family winged helix-turn-helix transcriptional regulator n=1 Tax=Homoserinimonas sedimenticola TaxID=2986805 RepID=UPI0022355303|nr:MarR family winged helix-turn-helix transcriptional regulator [Salinibacterium sedimenticola]MCW4385615.1 MarR family winged helix-turn-helix transcriptional regulator [Salinibacterium sedimenticola]